MRIERVRARVRLAASRPDTRSVPHDAVIAIDHDEGTDPFFSTKAAGRGPGLAVVHGIVRGHHGAIRVATGQIRLRFTERRVAGFLQKPFRSPDLLDALLKAQRLSSP